MVSLMPRFSRSLRRAVASQHAIWMVTASLVQPWLSTTARKAKETEETGGPGPTELDIVDFCPIQNGAVIDIVG